MKWGEMGGGAGDRDPNQATVTLRPHRQVWPLPFEARSDRSAVWAR